MSVPPESIQVGQCYLTDGGRIRRVTRIMPDGRIQFERRAASQTLREWGIGMADARSFAFSVERPVPCDWTLGRDG